MRIVEPRQFKHSKSNKRRLRLKPVILFVLVAFTGIAAWYAWQHPPEIRLGKQNKPEAQAIANAQKQEEANQPKIIKTFTGEEFKQLYRTTAFPNTHEFSEPPPITSYESLDQHIRQLAEARGYRLTSIPVAPIIKTEEATADVDDLLQPLAYEGWQALKATAEKEGIPLVLLSAYRSPEFQRELFMDRLLSTGTPLSEIVAGRGELAIQVTLGRTAVPGYSRHHSGYVVDFNCLDGSSNFEASSCFTWLKANNYQKAKAHGWIPSYPKEADEQGPEPEAWEYVWVGIESLLQ